MSALLEGCDPNAAPALLSRARLLLLTKGGGHVLAELKPESCTFTRELDDTSTLSATVPVRGGFGELCCEDVQDLYPLATELAVVADGDLLWVGPVVDIQYSFGSVEIEAADLSFWWERRLLPTIVHEATDLAFIARDYHEAAMMLDPSPNFDMSVSPCGVSGDRTVLSSDYVNAKEKIDELAETAVDWTVYGRTAIVTGQEIWGEKQLVLTDNDFEEPLLLKFNGSDMANRVVVKGRGGIAAVAEDEESIGFYGLVERDFYEPDIRDTSSLQAAADSRLRLLIDPMFLEMPSESSLKLSTQLRFDNLIPGVRVQVISNRLCKPVSQMFRLSSIKADFTGRISLALQPLGATDTKITVGNVPVVEAPPPTEEPPPT